MYMDTFVMYGHFLFSNCSATWSGNEWTASIIPLSSENGRHESGSRQPGNDNVCACV